MEMIEPTMLLVLALVAFVAGFIDAVAGGGGMLTVPALLSLGLPPHIALGTNKLAASFASSPALWFEQALSIISKSGSGRSK
ncbi:MAG: TSUP family transporter, partial [Pseudomonadota bacterium]